MRQITANKYVLLGTLIGATAIGFFLYFAVLANLDLSQGSYVLSYSMDELLIFQPVKEILHSENPLRFVSNLISGGYAGYGNVVYNTSALFSAIPEYLYGESGQIFVTRMTLAAFLLAAYIILVFTFLDSWLLRGLGLWVLITFPYTAFHSTLPKPEPLQLFFLAIFLSLAANYSFRFGYHWLFLGLACGTKAPFLATLPFFSLLGLIQQTQNLQWINVWWLKYWKKIIRLGILWFVIYGIAAGIVLLLNTKSEITSAFFNINPSSSRLLQHRLLAGLIFIILALVAIAIFKKFEHLQRIIVNNLSEKQLVWIKTTGIFLLGFGLANPRAVFTFPWGSYKWLYSSLFTGTTLGTNDSTVNWLTWVKYIFTEWSGLPIFLFILMTVLAVIIVSIEVISVIHSDWRILLNRDYRGIPTIIAGLFLCVVFFVSIQRTAGRFIYPGMVLIVVGVMSTVEVFLRSKLSMLRNRYVSVGIVLFFLATLISSVLFYGLPSTTTQFLRLSQRTASPVFQRKKSEYGYLVSLFSNTSMTAQRQILVMYDPRLFRPNTTPEFDIQLFWGAFNQWDSGADLVVMYKEKTPEEPLPSPTRHAYKGMVESNRLFHQYVSNSSESCQAVPCYAQIQSDLPEVRIFARRDLLQANPQLQSLITPIKPTFN